jgi:hypothetical protein
VARCAEGVRPRLASEDDRLADQPAQEPQVRDGAEDDRVVEGTCEPLKGDGAIRAPGDDLGQHRVEPAADHASGHDAGIDPDAVAGRPAQGLDATRRRQEPVLRILGVEADFHRVAGPPVRDGLVEPKRLAGRDPQLVGDEITTGHEFRDGVLDLQPRVHLEERRLAAIVDKELAGTRAHVADGARERERGLAESMPKVRRHYGRRRLFENLLVAALDRAVALAQVHAVAVAIEDHLDLDVTPALDEALEDETVVAEGRHRLAPRGREGVREAGGVPDRAHPLATAAGRRLDDEREADARRGTGQRTVGLVGPVIAGQDRNTQRRRQPPRRGLVAHRPDGSGRWADPADPGGPDRLREVRVLGEEAEARVERVGTGSE